MNPILRSPQCIVCLTRKTTDTRVRLGLEDRAAIIAACTLSSARARIAAGARAGA